MDATHKQTSPWTRWLARLFVAAAVGAIAAVLVVTSDSDAPANQHQEAATDVTTTLFENRELSSLLDRPVTLEGMRITETVGDRLVYVRPAGDENHLPLLVDLTDARDLELRVGQLVSLHGILHRADPERIRVSGLDDAGKARLEEAGVYLHVLRIEAPPPS